MTSEHHPSWHRGGGVKIRQRPIALKEILRAVALAHGISQGRIVGSSHSREASLARGLVAYLAVRTAGHRGRGVADFLHRDPSVIVRMVERVEAEIGRESRFRRMAESLGNHLVENG